MPQVPTRKDDWLSGGSRGNEGQVPEIHDAVHMQNQNKDSQGEQRPTEDAPQGEADLVPDLTIGTDVGVEGPAEAVSDAAGPMQHQAQHNGQEEQLHTSDAAQDEAVSRSGIVPVTTQQSEESPLEDAINTTVLEEQWLNRGVGPRNDEWHALHPLPKGLVELYGLLAVLLVLVPEWLAGTLLERLNISRGGLLTPFSVAWRRDPELLMGMMTILQLRLLAHRLGIRHYARDHREKLVNRLLTRIGEVDLQDLDQFVESLK